MRVSRLKYGAQAAAKACVWLAPTAVAVSLVPWMDPAAHMPSSHAGHSSGALSDVVPWLVMILAMIPILLQPLVQYVWRRSFSEQRLPNAGALIVGYLAVWLIASILATMTLRTVESSLLASGWVPPALGTLAAAWQISRFKRWAWERCHQSMPIRGKGLVATLRCARLGARSSAYCVITCLPLMTAAMGMPSHRMAMVAATALACYERVSRRPDFKLGAAVILAWVIVDGQLS